MPWTRRSCALTVLLSAAACTSRTTAPIALDAQPSGDAAPAAGAADAQPSDRGESADRSDPPDGAPIDAAAIDASPIEVDGGFPSPDAAQAVDSGPVDPACANVDCGHGRCAVQIGLGFVECRCDPGYLPYGLRCTEERRLACRNADGSIALRGTTRCSADDLQIEVCSDGDGDQLVEWINGVACNAGTTCSQGCRTAPCPDQPCPIGTACVPSAHGQPLGVCVATCDCSNCSNCGPDNSDGRWDDWQESCDNLMSSPPRGACRLPCPQAGDGCIPYNPSICWPIEGCFSGAP